MDYQSEDAETLYDDQDIEAEEWDQDDNEDDESEAILLKRSPLHNDNYDVQTPGRTSLTTPSSNHRSRWTRRERIPIPSWLTLRSRKQSQAPGKHTRKTWTSICIPIFLKCLAAVLMLFGLFQLFLIVTNLFFNFHSSSNNQPGQERPSDPTSHWPTDTTADILPVHCHSHNDYWRPIPLTSAIEAGCTGVEADVWQLGDELYVGHSLSSLTAARTFRSLYVEPILALLNAQNPNTTIAPFEQKKNGIFDTDPDETLVLLVDFKPGDSDRTWRYVVEQLEPLRQRGYLRYFNGEEIVQGAVTVVATGEAPFRRVVENVTYRDIFFDAPLDGFVNAAATPEVQRYDPTQEDVYLATTSNDTKPQDSSIYTPFNSYYASTSFYTSIGLAIPFLRDSQMQKIRRQIVAAHAQGLKVRYWETPGWPVGLRNYIWRVLVREGVDYLNVDDVWTAARGDWGWLRKMKRRRLGKRMVT